MNRIFTFVAAATLAAGSFTAMASEESDRIFSNIISHPAEGENVEYLGFYNIGFPDAEVVVDNSDYPQYECVLRNETTGKTWELIWSSYNGQVTGKDKNGFQFLFTNQTNITEKGEYTISFPVGAFLWEGEMSPAIVRHFSIGQVGETPEEPGTPNGVCPLLEKWEATPENDAKVDQLTNIVITFPDANIDGETNMLMCPMDGKSVTLTNTIGRTFSIDAGQYDGYKGIEVTVKEILIDGYYTLTIAQGYGQLWDLTTESADEGDIETPEIVVHYTVGDYVAVTALEGDDALYTVVDAGGRVLLSEVPAEALRSLEPGFYVINGRKTFLRK